MREKKFQWSYYFLLRVYYVLQHYYYIVTTVYGFFTTIVLTNLDVLFRTVSRGSREPLGGSRVPQGQFSEGSES